MTTPHTGDEDELVTADHADDETEQPEQAAHAENTAPPDPVDEAEPDEVEQDEVPREMDLSLPAPIAFNIDATDLYSEWKHWSSALEIYSIASDLQKKNDAVQRATMLHCLGPAVQRIFNTLPGEHESLEEAKTALSGYFAPKRNVVAERYKFRSRAQKADESFDACLTSLRELVKSCDFGTLEEEMVRDQIIEKCSSQTLKQKLLQQEDLDLAKNVRIALNAETAVQEARLLSQGTRGNPIQIKSRCNKCKKVGHLQRVCRSKSKADQRKGKKGKEKKPPMKVRSLNSNRGTDWLETAQRTRVKNLYSLSTMVTVPSQ